jgi:hypothetical protein
VEPPSFPAVCEETEKNKEYKEENLNELHIRIKVKRQWISYTASKIEQRLRGTRQIFQNSII